MKGTNPGTIKRHRKKSILWIIAGTILLLSGLFFLFMPAEFIRHHFAADSNMAFFTGMLCLGLGLIAITLGIRKITTTPPGQR